MFSRIIFTKIEIIQISDLLKYLLKDRIDHDVKIDRSTF